ncbi:MAG: type II toxin-antitoxin system VapC family toxin [Actinomycetota bacterium]|nr:type II toxin-antitoxin system VapC family toxin [Actinomycetota bacterium]
MIVLDSSVILKWVIPDESDAEETLSYLRLHATGAETIAVPFLLFYEVANVLGTKPQLASSEGKKALDAILNLGLSQHASADSDYLKIIDYVKKYRISGYDAAYITLAENLGCDFVTADEKLAARVKDLAFVKLLG